MDTLGGKLARRDEKYPYNGREKNLVWIQVHDGNEWQHVGDYHYDRVDVRYHAIWWSTTQSYYKFPTPSPPDERRNDNVPPLPETKDFLPGKTSVIMDLTKIVYPGDGTAPTDGALECPGASRLVHPNDPICTNCPIGRFSQPGTSTCTYCPAGRIQASTRLTELGDPNEDLTASMCKPCPPGTYSTTRDSTCTDCTFGYYQPIEGQKGCIKCPVASFSTVEGSDRVRSCTCGQDFSARFYTETNPLTLHRMGLTPPPITLPLMVCDPCPEGGNCPGGTEDSYASEGWWMACASSTTCPPVKCPNPEACIKSSLATVSCAAGYQSAICGACNGDRAPFSYTPYTCLECDYFGSFSDLLLFLNVGILILVLYKLTRFTVDQLSPERTIIHNSGWLLFVRILINHAFEVTLITLVIRVNLWTITVDISQHVVAHISLQTSFYFTNYFVGCNHGAGGFWLNVLTAPIFFLMLHFSPALIVSVYHAYKDRFPE